MKQYAYFEELPLKTHFVLNGNLCIKRSSRTLELIGYDGLWFYAKNLELCIVGSHKKLDNLIT